MDFKQNTCDVEYAKDPRIKKEDIQQLLEWVEKQPHMPKIPDGAVFSKRRNSKFEFWKYEYFTFYREYLYLKVPMEIKYMLIQFYYVCDRSFQKTKLLVEKYYNYKNYAPELFEVDDPAAQSQCTCDFWESIYCFTLPNTTPEGYRMIYFGLKNPNLATFSTNVEFKLMLRVLLTTITNQGVCPGYVIIYDMKGFNFGHIAGMNLLFLKKFIYFSQEMIPLNVKSVYIINGHGIINKLEILLKPFVKKEINEMVHIQSNVNDLFSCINKASIPSDAGGTLPLTRDVLNGLTRDMVNNLSVAVNEELILKTDESKRIGGRQDVDSCVNADSFKKLVVD